MDEWRNTSVMAMTSIRHLAKLCVMGMVFFAWTASSALPGTSETRDRPIPLWSASVLASIPKGGADLKSPNPADNHSVGIAFLDDSRLMTYELDATGELSSRTSVENTSGFKLHASILEATSGRSLLTKDWNARAHNTQIQITAGGLVVRTGPAIQFVSKQFTEIDQIPLPQTNDDERWIISVSPSGNTILLNHFDRRSSRFEIRDGNTFRVKYAWDQTPPLRDLYTISDSAIVAANHDQSQIILGEFGGENWEASGEKTNVGCIFVPTFITETLIANSGCNHELAIFTAHGKSVMSDQVGKNETVNGDKFRAAQGCRVFAAAIAKGAGGGFFDTDVRTTGRRVVVYDLESNKQVLNVEVTPLPKTAFDFALSPDGSKLAILSDRDVSVYVVPQSNKAR